jgi:hypothetical protein
MSACVVAVALNLQSHGCKWGAQFNGGVKEQNVFPFILVRDVMCQMQHWLTGRVRGNGHGLLYRYTGAGPQTRVFWSMANTGRVGLCISSHGHLTLVVSVSFKLQSTEPSSEGPEIEVFWGLVNADVSGRMMGFVVSALCMVKSSVELLTSVVGSPSCIKSHWKCENFYMFFNLIE